ncbi:MAG: hypothetical protein HQ596_03285 [Candidatus Saganbacteria bacterium]|nr:hypothetical protein [Candidatus Saganbacteria bacterium]
MHNLKLISFNMQEVIEGQVPSVTELLEKLKDGQPISAEEVRLTGVPITILSIEGAIERGEIKEILEHEHKMTSLNPWHVIQRITNFGLLFDKEFKVGPYTVKIISPNPQKFIIEIKDIPVRDSVYERTYDAKYTLQAQIAENGIRLFSKKQQPIGTHDPNAEDISCDWQEAQEATYFDAQHPEGWKKQENHRYELTGLNLRQIMEELVRQIRNA